MSRWQWSALWRDGRGDWYNQAGSCATGVAPQDCAPLVTPRYADEASPLESSTRRTWKKRTRSLYSKVSNVGFQFSMWVLGGSRPRPFFSTRDFCFHCLPSFVLYSHNFISRLHRFYPTRSDISQIPNRMYLMTRYRLVLINSWRWNLNSNTISSLCVNNLQNTRTVLNVS